MYYLNRYKFNDFWQQEESKLKMLETKVVPDITIQRNYLEGKDGQLQLDLN